MSVCVVLDWELHPVCPAQRLVIVGGNDLAQSYVETNCGVSEGDLSYRMRVMCKEF